MKVLTRIRIVLFALMVLASFANFALNTWGNIVIVLCEWLMAISFIAEHLLVVFDRYKQKNKLPLRYIQLGVGAILLLSNIILALMGMRELIGYTFSISLLVFAVVTPIEALVDFFKKRSNKRLYENFFVATFFYGLVFKNLAWQGAAFLLIFSALFLLPYYTTTTIKFFKEHFKFGKALTLVLVLGSVTTVLLGLVMFATVIHWPFPNTLFYTSIVFSLVMIVAVVKWRYDYKGEKVTVLKGLPLLKSHIILIYYLAFVLAGYKYLVIKKLAPDYYSQHYPAKVYQINEAGINTKEKKIEYDSLIETYNNFIDHTYKNGFLK